jgi:predicted ArsR family transcriptional regulator
MSGEEFHNALAAASRRRVLQLVRDADEPLDVPAVAAAAGLHPNTARFHLDILARAGLVAERQERAGTRGRPRNVYSAFTGTHRDGYRLIASVLADHLARTGGDGERAGHDWAAATATTAGPPADLAEATDRATARFVEMGFSPAPTLFGPANSTQPAPDSGQGPTHARILLRACPFRDLAREHPGVVCAMHLGVLRATVGDAFGTQLRPFVEPELCVAEIQPRHRNR